MAEEEENCRDKSNYRDLWLSPAVHTLGAGGWLGGGGEQVGVGVGPGHEGVLPEGLQGIVRANNRRFCLG